MQPINDSPIKSINDIRDANAWVINVNSIVSSPINTIDVTPAICKKKKKNQKSSLNWKINFSTYLYIPNNDQLLIQSVSRFTSYETKVVS